MGFHQGVRYPSDLRTIEALSAAALHLHLHGGDVVMADRQQVEQADGLGSVG